MRQIIKLCNEIAGEIKERRERMMMKRMWYELNILALRKHVRPVSLFLLVHTLLWCDLTWLICQIGCDILEIPKALSDEYPSDHSLCRCLWRTDWRNDLSDA